MSFDVPTFSQPCFHSPWLHLGLKSNILGLPFFYRYNEDIDQEQQNHYNLLIPRLPVVFTHPSCFENVNILFKPVGFAEEVLLHQQNHTTVHNSNSCSCILIQTSGISLNSSIFLHFCNYGLAREFCPKIQESEEAAMPALSPLLTCLKALYCSIIASHPFYFFFFASRDASCIQQSASVPTFTSSQVCSLTINQQTLLADSEMNFVPESN